MAIGQNEAKKLTKKEQQMSFFKAKKDQYDAYSLSNPTRKNRVMYKYYSRQVDKLSKKGSK